MFICCTYIHTYLVPPIHTYMRSFCPLSLQKRKDSEFFFCFFYLTESRIGEEKKRKGNKKERKKKRRKSVSCSTYLPRDVGFFFLFFSSSMYTDIQVHVGTYLTYLIPYLHVPSFPTSLGTLRFLFASTYTYPSGCCLDRNFYLFFSSRIVCVELIGVSTDRIYR